MAQCLSDFSDFIPTLWMEIFHVVVLCFSWQAKALLHMARYIFQVLKSLSFNGFLRFSLCSRCVETKASAQRLAERCLTGKHSAISYLFLIWPHPKHCLLTDVGLGELHIEYKDHTKSMVQPEFDRCMYLEIPPCWKCGVVTCSEINVGSAVCASAEICSSEYQNSCWNFRRVAYTI